MALPQNNQWSADEYLVWEREQPVKHELIDNYVVDMTGASRVHNIISVNLSTLFNVQLRKKPCEIYAGDMRVKVKAEGTYTYPDVVVVCGEPKFSDDIYLDTLENPTVLIEILSDSTEVIDRKTKLDQYYSLSSVQSYLLVTQDSPKIESYTRQEVGWLYQTIEGLDATLKIDAIECELQLADVYEKVQFPSGDGYE